MPPALSNEHHWLSRLVGDWTYETEATPVPGEPSIKDSGTEHVRSLGGMWVVCEGSGLMPDGTQGTTLMTIGYDSAKGRCVGTFVGTMMTTLWVYEGSLDITANALTLYSEGPSFTEEGALGKYKDVTLLESDDHRVFSSYYLNQAGEWELFMTTHYHRHS